MVFTAFRVSSERDQTQWKITTLHWRIKSCLFHIYFSQKHFQYFFSLYKRIPQTYTPFYKRGSYSSGTSCFNKFTLVKRKENLLVLKHCTMARHPVCCTWTFWLLRDVWNICSQLSASESKPENSAVSLQQTSLVLIMLRKNKPNISGL